MLTMGRVTLLALQLPPCHEDDSVRNSLRLDADLLPPTTPLLKGIPTNVIVVLRRSGVREVEDTVNITAHGGVLIKLTASASDAGDGDFRPSVPALTMEGPTERVALTVLLEASEADQGGDGHADAELGVAVTTRRQLSFALSNSNAVTSVDLLFEVPLRATSIVTETDGRAHLCVELHNTLSAAIFLHKHTLLEAVVCDAPNEGPEDLNSILEWPVRVDAQQRVSFVWRLPGRSSKRSVRLVRWTDFLSSSRQLYEAAVEFSVAPLCQGASLAPHQEPQPVLRFLHKAVHVEPTCRFLADLVHQPRGGNDLRPASAAVPTVGEFSQFEVRLSVFGDCAWDGGTDSEGAPSPLPVKYTIEVDPKRWMVSKRFPPLAPLFFCSFELACTAEHSRCVLTSGCFFSSSRRRCRGRFVGSSQSWRVLQTVSCELTQRLPHTQHPPCSLMIRLPRLACTTAEAHLLLVG
jgi:hypothetical protein